MSRSSLFIAASLFALGACQPASDPSEALVAETPPPITEPETEAVSDEASVSEEVASADSETVEEEHDHDESADHDHDHDEHGAEADEHDHDHDGHDHDEDHDHEDHDHDHAGGEAHVHGLSDLAVSLDATTLSVSVEGALANFDLDETLRELDDDTPYTDGLIALVGGDCTRDAASVSIRPIGDHGNLMVDLSYTCTSTADVEAIDLIAFDTFNGFEEVNAVILTDTGQSATTLTGSERRLDLR